MLQLAGLAGAFLAKVWLASGKVIFPESVSSLYVSFQMRSLEGFIVSVIFFGANREYADLFKALTSKV